MSDTAVVFVLGMAAAAVLVGAYLLVGWGPVLGMLAVAPICLLVGCMTGRR